ncbi:ABC transporter ATP-binding protein [Bacillus kwashiorkori]|uniref:ABC transporter ATP-binding protein n=1 Tax=Bacillus kwashiorkori TaxID=1522318 RepID=UPI000780AD30|nr:ABC transporter ATP-binding protein [Bacillus kwashiorkori]
MVKKRLFNYAKYYKSIIFAALFMLTIAVVADIIGPFVAKSLIDDHILGIEDYWVETDESNKSVNFNGKTYTRSTYLIDDHATISATIIQAGRNFYFIEDQVPLDGEYEYADGKITVSNLDEVQIYDAQKLSVAETMLFYGPEIPMMILLIAIYFSLFVISGIFNYGQYYFLQKAANRIIQKMRNDAFQKIQTLPISYFDNLPAGKIVARITNDTEAIRDLYVAVLSNFFTGFVYLTGIYTAMFILNAKLAFIFLGILPLIILWMVFYRKFASKYNHVIRSKISEINGMINESIQGMTIIQAFNRQKTTMNEFETLNETHFQYQNKLLSLNSLSSHNIVGLLKNIVFVGFIVYFGYDAIGANTAITIGVLYAYVDYINRLFNPISNIINQLSNLEQAMVAGERVFQLLDEKGKPISDKRIPRFQGNVQFKNVYFSYEPSKEVLKDINFSAHHGETVAFVGHTGSGKSSIMNLLFRFYDCTKGEITIDGKNIQTIDEQTLRDHMAIVLQEPYLFTGTIATNVSLGDTRITREKIEASLKAVGADKVLKNLQKGIDEPVIEKGSTLSSGQRQLISFARALAFNPAILILDEATSNIDTETESIIQNAMQVLKEGRTTFIIAHRLSTIKDADQIIVLDQGTIVEKGNHEQLMELKGKYYQMYQLQQGETFNQVS